MPVRLLPYGSFTGIVSAFGKSLWGGLIIFLKMGWDCK
jgi:hypothetical protein